MYKKYLFEVLKDVRGLKDGKTLKHEEVICRLETEYGVVEIQNFNDDDEQEAFCYPIFIYLNGDIHDDSEDYIENVYGYDSEQLQKVCLEYMDYMVKDLKTEHHFVLSEMECYYLMSIFDKYEEMNDGIEDVYRDVVNKIYERRINEE